MDTMEVDDNIYLNKSLTLDGLVTQVDFERRRKPSRCVTMSLGLLCVVLLAANIGQFTYYELHPAPVMAGYDALTHGGDARRNSSGLPAAAAAEESDRLQRDRDSLAAEKGRLEARLGNLTGENEHLRSGYNSLQTANNRLRFNTTNLAIARDRLERRVVKLEDKIFGLPCQTGWKKFELSCYFISTQKLNWTESRKSCKAQDADLVVIDSRSEQVFVHGLLGLGQNAWIGLTDHLVEGLWMWVDWTFTTTTYWQPGQPNSFNGNQDCGEMVQNSTMAEGMWNDDGCFAEQSWICEK